MRKGAQPQHSIMPRMLPNNYGYVFSPTTLQAPANATSQRHSLSSVRLCNARAHPRPSVAPMPARINSLARRQHDSPQQARLTETTLRLPSSPRRRLRRDAMLPCTNLWQHPLEDTAAAMVWQARSSWGL